MVRVEVPVREIVDQPEVVVPRDLRERLHLGSRVPAPERVVRVDEQEHPRPWGRRLVRPVRVELVVLPVDVDLDGLRARHPDLVVDREEARVRGHDLVPRPQEGAGRHVLPLDSAVRDQDVLVLEAEVLLHPLREAEQPALERVQVVFRFLDAPHDLAPVSVRELEVVDRRHRITARS